MKTEQRASDGEKQVNEVVINEENRTGGHGFTSGVSPKKTNMLGKKFTTGHLTYHEHQGIWTAIQHASISKSPT